MNKLFLIIAFLSGFYDLIAQNKTTVISDNINIVVKEINSSTAQSDSIISPNSLSLNSDTAIQISDSLTSLLDSSTVLSDSVELSLSFEIKDFKGIKWIELRYGTVEGAGNLLAIDFQLLKKNGRYYLKDIYGGTEFQVNNGIVNIIKLSSREALNANGYIGITVKDSNHKDIYKLNKSAR